MKTKVDLYGIERTTLKRGAKKSEQHFKDKDYISRGVLNVRYALNRNLGKSGKYSNRMILETAKIHKYANRNNASYRMWTKVPNDGYVKIVAKIYTLLYTIDSSCCEFLMQRENVAGYRPKIQNNSRVFSTVVPIQTNIIVRSQPETEHGKKLRKDVCDLAK